MLKRRTRRKQGKGLGRRIFRAAKVLALCVGASLVLGWAAGIALRPFLADRRELAEIRRLQTQIRDAKAQRGALKRQIRLLNTDKGIEVEARRAGLVRKGEEAIQTFGSPTSPAPPSQEHATPALGAVASGDDLLQRGISQAERALGHKPETPLVEPAGASKHPPTPQ